MTDDPQVWHYGLIARWWAEFNTDGPEIGFFDSAVRLHGEPALDVACGAGRLLVPFLQAGLDVDGCDISPDMLALCEDKARAAGLTPRLYPQAMHELDLPRRYRTIIVCGGFGLGGSRAQDQDALRRFRLHLQPDGTLLLDNYLPYEDASEWSLWVDEERRKLPQPWPAEGRRNRAADGDEIELWTRVADVDPLDQVVTRQIRAVLWSGETAVRQEDYTLLERLYFRNELLDMLDRAGFSDVEVLDGYSDRPASAGSTVLVYVAKV